ncbi:MAG: hypothetical protein J0J04_07855 [Microbacterium sp.]|uniref:hypothetical protein n=1 Tax=Microbacterium sp. TaxID=51671 RepID=UPI001AC6F110|nr:hypothetical protein [Microbacterium sp.]MBN9214713.1 hypothetical protein [Microbacterium sp.]
MGFEVFDARVSSRAHGRLAVVTSPRNNVLRLSAGLHRALGTDRAQLLWDAEAKRLAVRAATVEDVNSFPIGARTHAIGCAAFLRHIGEAGDDRVWAIRREGDLWMSE